MEKADVAVLFDYLYWLRDRVLTAVSTLPPDGFLLHERGAARDLRATLVHELDVEWSWRERLRTGSFPDADDLRPEDYASLADLAAHWRRDETDMRAWLDELSDAQLATPPPGERAALPLWYYAMHLVSHAIQQCTEAAVLLTRAGHSPGEIGFLEFAQGTPAARARP